MDGKNQSSNKETKPKFNSKHIKHNPQSESAKAVFGLREENENDFRTYNELKNKS
jgi:hypothetical protein